MTPLRKGMELDDALPILGRYRDWRKGAGPRDFAEAGFTVQEIAAALDAVVAKIPAITCENRSLRSKLSKCQVDRHRIHLQLRTKGGNEFVLGDHESGQ